MGVMENSRIPRRSKLEGTLYPCSTRTHYSTRLQASTRRYFHPLISTRTYCPTSVMSTQNMRFRFFCSFFPD